jgi:small glutamine-rich tetratricopeptide repeat-containing protein alpha
VPSDEAESIEIANNCIAEAFKVDPTDEAATKEALGGKSLSDIYGVYEKLRGKTAAASASASASSKPAAAAATATGPDDKTKEEAEKLKSQGNAAMQKKDYPTAIDFYTKALNQVPLNPIYLSNRAAAYSGSGKHEEAVSDAEMAVASDPKFAKAWSRLGYAKFALGDSKGSMDAYQKGIDAEGNGGSEVMRKGLETAKRRIMEEGGSLDDDEEELSRGAGGMPGGMPDLSSLGSMFGGGGAGGPGGGGLPNFSEMMQNPMMASMANKLMSDPSLMNNLLANPRLKDMFGGAGRGAGGAGGGGMPDMSSLMSDPSIQEL